VISYWAVCLLGIANNRYYRDISISIRFLREEEGDVGPSSAGPQQKLGPGSSSTLASTQPMPSGSNCSRESASMNRIADLAVYLSAEDRRAEPRFWRATAPASAPSAPTFVVAIWWHPGWLLRLALAAPLRQRSGSSRSYLFITRDF